MAKLSKALGTDLAALAQLIRSHGRGKDTILAHITPQEAALLKARGGSGSINPITGLPEFQEEFVSGYDVGAPLPEPQAPATSFEPVYGGYSGEVYTPTDIAPAPVQQYTAPEFALPQGYDVSRAGFTPSEMAAGSVRPVSTIPSVTPSELAGARAELGLAPLAPERPGFMDEVTERLKKAKLEDVLRIGGIGALGALGGARARTGARQAQQIQTDLQSMAAPYYTAGQEYIQRGQTGALLPAQQQALETQRAQAAQARARAGVSATSTMAAQQEASIQRQADLFRQQLIDYGFKLTGIADNITKGAIQAGYSASQDAQNAAARFYMAMGQMVPGVGTRTT